MRLSFTQHLILVLIAACMCAAAAVPDSATKKSAEVDVAEGRLKEWLAVFNTGQRHAIHSYVAETFVVPPGELPFGPMLDYFLKIYRETGGLELQKVVASDPASITALCRGKATGYWMKVRLSIDAAPPDYAPKAPFKVSAVGLDFIEAPTELLEKRHLSDEEIRDKTAALMANLVQADLFSGAVLVARDDTVLFKSAYGQASRAWNMPNRTDTRFHLASITKMFTAVAIAGLVEEGKLKYETRVGEILPDYPNRTIAEEVTVRQLLSHTSGIKDKTEWMDTALRSSKIRTIPDFVKTFADEPLEVKPGTAFNYSNAGYILLGAIIEKVTGQDYYSAVRQRVFQRAGMDGTDFFELDSNTPNLAEGYVDGPNGTRLNNFLLLGVKGMPAGGAYASVEDMFRFSAALRTEKLLRRNTLERMWEGVNVPGHDEGTYGYGCTLASYNGARIVGHGGGWSGVTNVFEILPEQRATIVILSNYDSNPSAIANKLHEWITQRPNNVISVPPKFSITAKCSPEDLHAGEAVTISVSVTNVGGPAKAMLVDCEVKDARGSKVHQQFTEGQRFGSGSALTYTYMWTPAETGSYSVDVGVFGSGWSPKYRFDAAVAKITVR